MHNGAVAFMTDQAGWMNLGLDFIPGRTNKCEGTVCADVGSWRINDAQNCRFALKYDSNAGSGETMVVDNGGVIVVSVNGNGVPVPVPTGPQRSFMTPVGCAWSHNYFKCISIVEEGVIIGNGNGGGVGTASLNGGGGGLGQTVLLYTHGTRTDRFVQDPLNPGRFISNQTPGFYINSFQVQPDQSVVMTWENGNQETFRPLNHPIAPGFVCEIKDRHGNRLVLIYNLFGLLECVFDNFVSTILPLNACTFEPTESQKQLACLKYAYDPETLLLSTVTDRSGRTVTLTHDSQKHLVAITSPAVTGTPNGNDFPFGKTTVFGYTDVLGGGTTNGGGTAVNGNGGGTIPLPGEDNRFCLLTSITKPNEVAAGLDEPAVQIAYDLSPLSVDACRVTHLTVGGTNQAGFTAGGTISYQYLQLAPPTNGGPYVFANPVVIPNEPHNAPVFRVTVTDRNTNVTEYETNQLGNIVSIKEFTRGIRAGDPAFFHTQQFFNPDGEMTFKVLPEGNVHQWSYDDSSPDRAAHGNVLEYTRHADTDRGGDQAFITERWTYEPAFQQVLLYREARENDPSFVPQIGGPNGPGRFTTHWVFDYQESAPDVVAPELASKKGVSAAFMESLLLAVGPTDLPFNLGDVNGDGRTGQIQGNIIQRRMPPVTLPDNSIQIITQEQAFNDVGQYLFSIDGEGNKDTYEYHPENDPNGDGMNLLPGVSTRQAGYLFRVTQDTAFTAKRTRTAALTNIMNDTFQDEVGNVIRTVDGRRNDTLYFVNQLNQEVERRYELPFRYRYQDFFDHNNNGTQRAIENRTVLLDAQKRPVTDLFLGTPDFFRDFIEFDILDDVRKTDKDATGSTPSRLVTLTDRDANQNPTQITRPEGNKYLTSYDERDLRFEKTRGALSADASTMTYNFDLNRNPVETLDAIDNSGDGNRDRAKTEYDGFDRARAGIDPLGNRIATSFDPASNGTEVSSFGHPPGPSPMTDSGATSVPMARTSVRFDEISRAFESCRHLFVDAGHAPRLHRMAQLADQQGDDLICDTAFFDRNSVMVRAIQDDGDTSLSEFDGVDREVRQVDAEGNELLREYDENHNSVLTVEIERSADAAFPDEIFSTRMEYDSIDRLTVVEDPLLHVRRTSFDSRNNAVFHSDSNDGSTPDGIRNTNHGNTMFKQYDGFNRVQLTERHLRSGGAGDGSLDTTNTFNADGIVSTFSSWDGNSRLTTQTDDNGNTTTYGYNQRDVKTSETFADGTTNVWTLDLDDNPISFKDENGSIFFITFDGLNRRVRCDVSRAPGIEGTTVQTMEYDGLSRGTRETDNNDPSHAGDDADCRHVFDSLSRVIEEQQNPGDGTFRAVDSGWFSGERRVQLIYPSGRDIRFEHDMLDRQKRIRDNAETTDLAQYFYIGPVRVKRRDYQNGTRMSIDYDADRRPTNWRHTRGSKLLLGYAYGWDRENNRQFEQFLHRQGEADIFTYDSVYRVTDVRFGVKNPTNPTGADFQTSYTLDGVHNWRQFKRQRKNKVLFDDTNTVNEMNEYVNFQNTRETHDDNGNLTQVVKLKKNGKVGETTRLFWDAFNRLVRVERANESGKFRPVARFTYYGDHRRASKIELSSGRGEDGDDGDDDDENGNGTPRTTLFFYDGWRTIEEQDASGMTQATYVQGPMYIDEHITMDRRLGRGDGDSDDDEEEDGEDDGKIHGKRKGKSHGGDDDDEEKSGNQDRNRPFKRFFYHQNSIFSVMGLTNRAGALVERVSYDIYGQPTFGREVRFRDKGEGESRAPGSTKGNPYLLAGGRFDSPAGLYYSRRRYFDPDRGRYLGRDPLGIWEDSEEIGNGYTYAANSPTNWVDPYGLEIRQTPFKWELFVDELFGGIEEATKHPAFAGLPEGEVRSRMLDGAKFVQTWRELKKRDCPTIQPWYVFGKREIMQAADHIKANHMKPCTINLYMGHSLEGDIEGQPWDESLDAVGKGMSSPMEWESLKLHIEGRLPRCGVYACWAKVYNEFISPHNRIGGYMDIATVTVVNQIPTQFNARFEEFDKMLKNMCRCCNNEVKLNLYFGGFGNVKEPKPPGRSFKDW